MEVVGNCLYVESENTKLLIDAGVSLKKIETGLNSLNIDPSSIDGLLITHEHTDHIQSLGNLSKKYNIPVYANQKTFDEMPKQTDKISSENIKKFNVSENFLLYSKPLHFSQLFRVTFGCCDMGISRIPLCRRRCSN